MEVSEQKYFESHRKLFSAMEDFGFKLIMYSEEPRAFDNFYAIFSSGSNEYQVVRDRSLYHISDLLEGMEESGLNKAFKDKVAFRKAIVNWLEKKV